MAYQTIKGSKTKRGTGVAKSGHSLKSMFSPRVLRRLFMIKNGFKLYGKDFAVENGGKLKFTVATDSSIAAAEKPYVRAEIFEQRVQEMQQLLETSPIPDEFLKKQ